MTDPAARLFLRWRDRGEAEALAEVFDRTAPELLRVALHFCNSVADAEDLLQSTFVTAIESAPRFDARRPLVPWLVAILTHAAHAERRRRARANAADVEPDALAARGDEPGAEAATRELEDATLAALDRLPEPYRQPTMLRVRHGLSPADIALLLQRSPGTVRAQIHRGIEKLRRLLPAGVAGALALTGATGRGLAAVKSAVLAEAQRIAAAAVAGTSSAALGGLALMKKTLTLAALTAVALAIAFGMGAIDDEPAAPDRSVDRSAVAASSLQHAPPATTTAVAPVAVEGSRTEVAPSAAPDAPVFRARVVDGTNTAPLAGVDVGAFRPRKLTLVELQREFGAFGRAARTGTVFSTVEWLRVPYVFDPTTTVGRAPHDFLVPPHADQRAVATTSTDDRGRFAIPIEEVGAMLVVSRDGYGTRRIPVAEVQDEERVVELWPTRTVRGVVRMRDGNAPPQPLDLMLLAAGFPSPDAWLVTTEQDGAFDAEVAASRVRVTCRTPGFAVTSIGTPPAGMTTVRDVSVDAGVPEVVLVARFGSPRLHVTDAETGDPVETIGLVTRDERDNPRTCGTFWAEDGRFEITGFDPNDLVDNPTRSQFPQRVSIEVWSDGYAPQRLEPVALFGEDPGVIDVALERGDVPRARGRVHRSGRPVVGARVQLRVFSQLNWQDDTDLVVTLDDTDEDGTFELTAPPGAYLLEVVIDGDVEVQRQVAHPASEPMDVDLDACIEVTVTVLDADGHPAPDHNVAVNGPAGQQRQSRTGADGRVALGPFSPGKHSVMAPLEPTDGSWIGAVKEEVVLTAGVPAEVTLRVPRATTVRPQLVFDGEPPDGGFAGFAVRRAGGSGTGATVEVEADGTAPLDVPTGATVVVSGPDERRWRFRIPDDARPVHEFVLQWSGLGYAGVLADARGTPIARARVFATPDSGGATVSAVTDANGSFRLDGLAPVQHRLGFQTRAGRDYRELGDNPLRMVTFRTASPPAVPPVELQVRVPRFVDATFEGLGEARVSGQVLDAESGAPVAGAVVSAETVLPQRGGELTLFPPSGWQYSGPDGRYELVVAPGAILRIGAARDGQESKQETTLTDVAHGAVLERDLAVR